MTTYLITYDLRRPTQNYNQLIAELTRLGAVRAQASVWVLRSVSSAQVIFQHLIRFGLDANDKLLVTQVNQSNTWFTNGTSWPIAA